ncbi:MAG: hypothetical protein NC187_05430 [Candidatus Amulumruptor caecigallinarius]|nr:hypothetical protein [Candidatus Amulumruptor caecigallinarius]MCM1396912.1 hypothetical protein [Candidatus Amulumruptor caecigallinarius]MCM1454144.1 hypothetical protein [bacterium]
MTTRRLLASAVTHDGHADYNAIVTFTPGELPTVNPFAGELHSTEHVNGVVHFGDLSRALQTARALPALSIAEVAMRLAPLAGTLTERAWLLLPTPSGLTATPLP